MMVRSVLWRSCVLMVAFNLLPVAMVAAEQRVYESREEIPLEYRWNLEDILPTTAAFDEAVAKVEAAIPEIQAYAGRLGESPEVLADALALLYEVDPTVEDLYVWAAQWRRQDTRDAEAQKYEARARGLLAKYSEAVAFFNPEIAQIPDDKIAKYRKHPRLVTYDHMIDNIVRTKEHIRSAEVEEVLAGASLLTGSPGQIYGNLHDADLEWPTIQDEGGKQVTATPSLYYQFLSSPDRRVRRDAALAIFGTYSDYGNTFAGTLAASIHKDGWLTSTRGYESTLERALDADAVPPALVETLVATVHDNLDVIHRYIELRKGILGLDSIHIYDLYVNLGPEGGRSYTFDEGWQLAMEFWRETFGEEYAAVAARGFAERWIDVYPSVGKEGGAFSWGTYNSHPYLFLNWGDTLEDVFTLVHEMGHSVHTYLAAANQPYHTYDYSLFIAELGSVASESLFYEWLLERTMDPAERLVLVNQRINNFVGTFLRQIFFHEFEAEAHAMAARGEPLTKDSMGEVWAKLWTTYYGEGSELDEEFRAGWARPDHYYRTFYVWKYASSFAAGEAVAARFRAGDEGAVDDYLETLKLGGSVYPMDALERAGVDMTDPEVIRAVMVRFAETLDELEKLLEE
jgi:oligoendopeptidase F